MGDSPRTYDAPPAGAGATGVEDYVVEARDGARVGTVVTAIQQDGGRWLVVEAGTPPLRRKRRILPWADVQDVDHDALVVRLGLTERELEDAPQVDKSSELEEGAQGERRAALAADSTGRVPTGESAGPRDRSLWVVALASALLGVLALLGVVIAFSLKDVGDTWAWALLVIPAGLLGIAALTAYRLWRDPYERRGT
jgi:hypothetical protein